MADATDQATARLVAAWLAERRNGIGASEAAAVCGVSEYDTALDVYLRKVGLAPEKPESQAMSWGTRLEPLVADAYSERTGHGFRYEQLFVRNPETPWLFATAAYALGDQLGEDGSDVVPLPWRIQVLHQMVAHGGTTADIAALIGGQDLRIYTVPADTKVVARMLAIEAEFWDRVQRRDPPPADPDRDGKSLALLYPTAEGSIELPAEAEVEAVAWEVVREEIGRLTRQAERHKANVMAALGGAALATMSDGRIVSRKVVTRAAYACPESSYVDLRIRKGK
jgi:predicted phage-related endonuclease